ncbi:hypothetical protein [Bacillus testis]|uniref:hypothetical protein n=1 Tax=Bacillus testis TaxID=1622072 RepID=UPI00067F2AD9|nr:hypothetical protein [Bacillus testis]
MRERLYMCLLLIGVMLYYAIPHIKLYTEPTQILFAGGWLLLAFCAVAGNLSAILYKAKRAKRIPANQEAKERKRTYNY